MRKRLDLQVNLFALAVAFLWLLLLAKSGLAQQVTDTAKGTEKTPTSAISQAKSSARHDEGTQRAGASSEKVPTLSDAQKLEIRTAQVEMFQAKTVLESTSQFQAFQRAQNHLNETALKVQRESKVDPAKWTLGQDLEYTAVPQPEKDKK